MIDETRAFLREAKELGVKDVGLLSGWIEKVDEITAFREFAGGEEMICKDCGHNRIAHSVRGKKCLYHMGRLNPDCTCKGFVEITETTDSEVKNAN